MIKQLLIDKLSNEPNGARDYYLNDEERATIVECIKNQIANDDCDYHCKLVTLVNKDGRRRKALYNPDRMLCSMDGMTIEFLASRGWKIESGDNE